MFEVPDFALVYTCTRGNDKSPAELFCRLVDAAVQCLGKEVDLLLAWTFEEATANRDVSLVMSNYSLKQYIPR